MALTLTELFNKRNDTEFLNKVTAACWRHAKTMLAKATPTDGELRLAAQMLSDVGGGAIVKKFAVAAAVLIDDAAATDAAIENAVASAAAKLVALEI